MCIYIKERCNLLSEDNWLKIMELPFHFWRGGCMTEIIFFLKLMSIFTTSFVTALAKVKWSSVRLYPPATYFNKLWKNFRNLGRLSGYDRRLIFLHYVLELFFTLALHWYQYVIDDLINTTFFIEYSFPWKLRGV